MRSKLDEPIAELERYGLNDIVRDTLDRNGYVYVRDLVGVSESELEEIHYFRAGKTKNLKEALKRFLRDEPVKTELECVGVDLSSKPRPRLTGQSGRLI